MMLAEIISASKSELGLNLCLVQIEKQIISKHEESFLIPYLDESSNLSGSTDKCKRSTRRVGFFVL